MRSVSIGLLAVLLPTSALALTGSGTELDPYQVGSCADLSEVRTYVDPESSAVVGSFLQTADIDCSSFEYVNDNDFTVFGFAPIETFSGTYDGGGYGIDGLNIDSNQDPDGFFAEVGLFATLRNGTVRNLRITNAYVLSDSFTAGILAGYAEDSMLENLAVSGQAEGVERIGGVAGEAFNVTASNIFLATNVSESTINPGGGLGSTGIGGLFGVTNNATVTDVTGSSFVSTGETPQGAGGLVGISYQDSISRSSIAMDVSVGSGLGTAEDQKGAGGLVGYADGTSLTDCYATGQVSADYNVGGLVGYDAGGFIDFTAITNCYSTADINVFNQNAGSMVGYGGLSVVLNNSFAAMGTLPSVDYIPLGGGEEPPAYRTYYSFYAAYGGIPSGGEYTLNNFWFFDPGTGPGGPFEAEDSESGSASSGSLPCAPANYLFGACNFESESITFFHDAANPPLSSWDFETVWEENDGAFPTLRGAPSADLSGGGDDGGGEVVCVVGSPFDWDGDGSNDGCRGTEATLPVGLDVPVGTQIGNDVTLGNGILLGDGVVLHDGTFIADRASVGDNTTVGENTVVSRGATVGADATIGADSTLGRNSMIGDNTVLGSNTSVGYASQLGSHITLGSGSVIGNLAQLGGSGAAPGAISCTGPLILARGATIAADGDHTFSCTGLVVVGPNSSVGSGSEFGGNIKLRKSVTVGGSTTLGDDINIGRSASVGDGVTVSAGSLLASGVELCETSTPFSGTFSRGFADPACVP